MSDDSKSKPENQRIEQWECNGQRSNMVHPPAIYRIQSVSIMRDKNDRLITKTDRVTRLILEDSDAHQKLDVWNKWMGERQQVYLPNS